MPEQTFDITAPNGKTLSITGDHMPTESELRDIFKAAGVESGAAAMSADTSTAARDFKMPNSVGEALDTAGDLGIGFAKGAGRTVQMIPGVSRLTDYAYGLPPGASEKSMQSTNPAQTIGGYAETATELAPIVASGAGLALNARAGATVARNAAGQFTALSGPQQAVNTGLRVSMDAIRGARAELMSGGPVTAERVGAAAVRYGKDAMRLALIGLPGGTALYKLLK